MAHCKKERRGKSAGFFFFFFFFFFQISSNKPDDKALATYQVTFPCCSGTNLYKDKISGIQEKGIDLHLVELLGNFLYSPLDVASDKPLDNEVYIFSNSTFSAYV